MFFGVVKSHLILPLLFIVFWAGIYLPGLGDFEIKGEEPRRILPGVRMVETGDYLRVYVGARPYLRKPPLINWAVAGAMNVTGAYNEWVVRLPSTLMVLALGLTVFFAGRPWLGQNGAWLGAVFVLTNISLMEKGRLAEIEPYYISLFGIAMILFLAAAGRRAGGWLLWLPAGVFLGLGMLAKGPLHLLYFYAIAAGVLWKLGETRRFLHPGFWLSLALVFGPFLVWAQMFKAAMPAEVAADAGGVWLEQLTSRLGLDDFDWDDWLLNIPRGILNWLPWCLFLPLLWNREMLGRLEERDRLILLGARPAIVGTFIVISLLPGSLERYTLPLLVPALVLCAMMVDALDQRWLKVWRITNEFLLGLALFVALPAAFFFSGAVNGWAWMAAGLMTLTWIGQSAKVLPREHPLTLGGLTALACIGITLIYASLSPLLAEAEDARPMARQIKEAVPPGAQLWVQDSGFRQFWFYLEPEARFFWPPREFAFPETGSAAVLLPVDKVDEFLADNALRADNRELLLEIEDRRGDLYELYHLQRKIMLD